MQFYTLNQIINDLTTICSNHAQISQFEFGETFDISASEQQLYPLVWANVLTSTIGEKTLFVNMEILVMDIQKGDQSNERDTLSDTLSISQDIYAALTNPIYVDFFYVQPNIVLEPLREAYQDVVIGWKMTLIFELAQTRDRCQIPQ